MKFNSAVSHDQLKCLLVELKGISRNDNVIQEIRGLKGLCWRHLAPLDMVRDKVWFKLVEDILLIHKKLQNKYKILQN